jgi:integrase
VAIVALLWGCGLRRAELAGLTLADLQEDGRALRIDGKGGKERIVYLPPTCAEALARWLVARGSQPGALICATVRAKAGERRASPGVAVGPQAIYLRILALGRRAGVVLRPHDLRRTYIGDLLDAGVDLATVQASVGHSSPATTARYDRRGARAARDAAARLALPSVQDLDS